MFKAKLIHDTEYYRYKRKQLLFILLPALPTAYIIHFYRYPVWLTIMILLGYAIVILLGQKNLKRIKAFSESAMIEIDDQSIRLINKLDHSVVEIDPALAEKIIIPKNLGPDESFKDMTNEMKGNTRTNYIALLVQGREQRFDFVLESHYMTTQLENLIQTWVSRGYSVERI